MEMARFLCVATYFPIIYTLLDIFTAFQKFATVRSSLSQGTFFFRNDHQYAEELHMLRGFTLAACLVW